MGWRDRRYNSGREDMNAYFSNPGMALQYAFPLYTSSRLRIRLTFWFLLFALFDAIDEMRSGMPAYILLDIGVMLAVCLWHEWGHSVFARWVDGTHWEWVIWPLGGMVPPSVPKTPQATFVANIGGMVFSILLVGAAWIAAILSHGLFDIVHISFVPIGVAVAFPHFPQALNHAIQFAVTQSAAIMLINLFPCYWFDGGYIWQSILWPKLGQWKATRIVCLAGMILAAPLFLLSLFATAIFAMIFFALIFADCFNRRRALAADGPGVMDEDDSPYNYMDTPEPKRRKPKKSLLRSARRKASRDQAEQARIDAILAKVKDKGLHSLSWWEKRTLRRATERQRQRDLANRY